MPKAVVEDQGLERTDFGKLGSGIYFSNSVSASIKYISRSEMEGTQLGSCLELYDQDYSLNNVPSAYYSVHELRKTADISSDFEDDEFVVYKTCQVKIRYIVKFCLAEDQIKPFQPAIGMKLEQDNHEPVTMLFTAKDLCLGYALPNANLSNPVRTGLQDRLGNPVPLEGVYIKARTTDFVAQMTDLLFVDVKLVSMENTSLERMALGLSVHSWEKNLKFDVHHLINNFLIRKSIQSLGPNGKATAIDGCSCAAVHTLHKEIEMDSFQNSDKTG